MIIWAILDDWRSAAIQGVPFVMGWISRAATNAKARAEDAPVRSATAVRR